MTSNGLKRVEFAVQTDHFRMVNGTELYDHRSDPGERRNIAKAQPEQLAELDAAYESWWESVLPTIHNEEVKKKLARETPVELPNIVLILADDLGYGDVSCLNPESKIVTPNIDRLAESGMSFRNAHTPSAMCTPTRYGLLTGRYPWRTHLKERVLWTWEPPLIAENRLTLASMLQEKGYATSCFGKWHLGAEWNSIHEIEVDRNLINDPKTRGKEYDRAFDFGHNVDWESDVQVAKGPLDLGFDYYFGVINGHNTAPFAWIENRKSLTVPSELMDLSRKLPAEVRKKDLSRANISKGVATPGWKIEECMKVLNDKMVSYIKDVSKDSKPFFLFYPSPAVHLPLTPGKQFEDTSEIGLYGDFVKELDWTVGEMINALEEGGELDNTIIIFTSDNGPEQICHERKVEHNHFSAYHFKGAKKDNWEGGSRVPFIVSWPKKIEAGLTNDQLICLTDVMPTLADLVQYQLPEDAAEDGYSALPAILERSPDPIRDHMVYHSWDGNFGIVSGKWKLLLHGGSGGKRFEQSAIKIGVPPWPGTPGINWYLDAECQLYDLDEDIYESENLADKNPDIVKKLTDRFLKLVDRGRSNPGPPQKNDESPSWQQLDDVRRFRLDF